MKILIAGDYYDKSGVADLSIISPYLKQVDYSLVNYESPIPSAVSKPIEKNGPNLKASETSLKYLKDVGFDAVTLANNHIRDYGGEGVLNTIRLAQVNGLDVVGAGESETEASKILYKVINGETLAIINCCEHEFSIVDDDSAGANPLDPVDQYRAIQEARSNADYVLVIVHGGHEHYNLPSPRMQKLYRFFVDAGADAVVNHHQHCYTGYEVYNGKPIFYGIGNFFFPLDHPMRKSWCEGMLAIIDFNKDKIGNSYVPYYQCYEGNGFKVLEGDESFESNLKCLNDIIADPTALKEKFEEDAKKHKKSYHITLTPYSNRYLKALCRRGYLPSFLSKRKKREILNMVECEAHRDRLIEILKG